MFAQDGPHHVWVIAGEEWVCRAFRPEPGP